MLLFGFSREMDADKVNQLVLGQNNIKLPVRLQSMAGNLSSSTCWDGDGTKIAAFPSTIHF